MTNRAEIVITALDKASAVINRIADRMDVLGEKSNLGKAFERLGQTEGLEKINSALGRIWGNLQTVATYGTIAAGAIAASFVASLNAVDDFADALGNAGVKGKQLVELSAMRDFMQQFGVKSEDSSKAVLKLVENISKARSGGKEMEQAFAAAGVTMDDLRKKTPVEIMQKLMDTFSRSDKAGAKLRVLNALAGESSIKMSEALSQGAQAFEDYKERSKNALLTEKDFEDSGNAADALTRITALVARAGQKMAAVAAPRLQAFLDRREAGLLELIPRLVDWVDRFIASLDDGRVLQFFEDIGEVFGALGRMLRWLVENVNATVLIAGALALAFAPAIAAMTSIATVVIPLLSSGFAALGAALMANPIFIAIGLLAGAAFLIYKNWDGIMGGLEALWTDLGDAVSGVFRGMYDGFIATWQGIESWFAQKIGAIAALLPDWLTGGSLQVNANGSPAVQTSAQTVVQQGGRTEVGGRIRIELAGAPARVTQLSSNNTAVPIDVSAGLYGVGS